MAESRVVQQPFDNKGLILNVEPRLLPAGALQKALNVDTVQEGSITTRLGSKSLGTISGQTAPHTIRKLSVSSSDSQNPRYVGGGENIYRTYDYSSFTQVASLVVDPADSVRRRWNMAPYSAGSTGRPWALFACQRAMLKDRGDSPYATLQRWGILPGFGAVELQITGQSGSLDGGAPGSPPASNPYDYRFTYRNSQTGHEGNPSEAQFEPPGPEVLSANSFENTSKWQVTGDFIMGASEVLYSNATGTGTLRQTLANMASAPVGSSWYELTGEIRVTNPGDISLEVTTSFAAYAVSIPVRDGRFSVMLISKATPGDFEIKATATSGWLWITNLSLRKPELASGRVHLGKINVRVWGTDDPQVDEIRIYRRGGVYQDGIYRLVGRVANPGMTGDTPNQAVFTDDVSDESILYAPHLEFDNDPPITSTLPVPYTATISFGGGEAGPGWVTATFSVPIDSLTVGTLLYLSGGTNAGKSYPAEQVRIVRKISSLSARIYLQAKHFSGESVTADAVVGKPADLVISAFDSIFVAGDDNNPHVLRKSKTGRPESFPVATEAGTVNEINVGTPANGIVNMTEFGGRIVCLNVSGIFEVPVWRGQMQSPIETPAHRGLYARYAWAKGDNVIFYLAYDGIYAWSGGESVKISHEIDPLFRGMAVQGMEPVAMDVPEYVAWFSMEYYRNRLYFNYRDKQGNVQQIVYDTLAKRWLPWALAGGVTAMYTETDVGRMVVARYSPSGGVFSVIDREGTTGTTDEFPDSQGIGGTPIPFSFKTAFFDLGDPLESKLFTGAYVDLENPAAGPSGQNNIKCRIYYDYSDTPSDEFTITETATRARRLVPLPIGSSGAGTPTSGREARAVAFEFFNAATAGLTRRAVFYSLSLAFTPLGRLQFGEATAWDDLGHPWDKHLRMVTIEAATFGEEVEIALDTMSGIAGATYNAAVATFTINSGGTISDPRTAKRTFPIPEGTIAKLVRLRPTVESALVRISSVSFQKDDYPPDFVFHTEPSNWGSASPKYAQEVFVEVDTGGQTVPVKVMADGSVAATISVQTSSTDRFRRISIAPSTPAVMWWLSIDPAQVPAGGKFQLFRYQIGFEPADKGAISHTSDWDDLGWPFDKHLRSVTIEFEGASTGVTVQIDTLSGVKADNQTSGAITLNLSGQQRQRPTFGIAPGKIVKMVRIRPSGTIPASFKIWRYIFDFEKYPQDIVYHTEPTDSGYPFRKYYQQLILDVDTGGVAASFTVEVDGQDVANLSVQTNFTDRRRTLTLPPSISGRQARIKNVAPGTGGKFQLFLHQFVVSPADKGPVVHTWDWDDLGHPYDKLLLTCSVEYEVTQNATVRIEGLRGVTGSQSTFTVADLSLVAGGRRKESFPMPDQAIVKMVRLYPLATNTEFKYWRYLFEKQNYPADVVSQTEWSDLGWPYEKIARWLILDVDTGGVAATVNLEADGQTMQTFTVTTSQFDRYRIIATNPNLIGKMWRLTATPGPGGKFQLFAWRLEHVKEPPLLKSWRSYETTFGVESWKYIKQVWVEYYSLSPVTFTIWVDGNVQFYQKILPIHTSRMTERFFLPAANGLVLNKSKVYLFGIDSDSGVKLYPAGTRCEWRPISGDQRASFLQTPLLSGMQFEGVS